MAAPPGAQPGLISEISSNRRAIHGK
jgi:hypothetical protein